jgi:hypothetical protein
MKFGSQSWSNAMKVYVTDSSAQQQGGGPNPTPEPGTLVLLGAAGAVLALKRWRLRRSVG